MVIETGLKLVSVGRVAVQDGEPGDDPPFHLIQPNAPAKLDVMTGFAFADNGGVWLKHADQFLRGGHALSLQDAAGGLVDDLLDARQEGRQLSNQAAR